VLVAGPGSLWNTDAAFWIGALGQRAFLTVTNGARVRSGVGVIDASRFTTPALAECSEFDLANSAVVTGPGSVWECRTNLVLGTFGRGNRLDIRNGGLVASPALMLGDASVSLSNFLCSATPGRNILTVDDGSLAVTNAARSGVLEIRNGVIFMQRGSIVLDELRATNRNYGRFDLLGGSARLRRAYFGTVLPFIVGDGLNAAELFVDSFDGGAGWGAIAAPAGMIVQPHSTLTGGVLFSGSLSNAGTLRPGGYGGSYFDFTALNLSPSSTLHFDIDGRLYTTNYHPINVGSPLFLRGVLHVTLQGGFVPAQADVFSVIGCAQVTNSFDNVVLGGRVTTTDGLGSFLVSFNGFNINLSNYQSADLDGDGIDDAWATNYFGHTPLTPAERAADADNDGASNADEFHAGTNPNSAASVLRAALSFIGGRPAVTFPCVNGKSYRLHVSNDLLTWSTVSEPAFTYPAPGLCSWTDDGTDTGGLGAPTRFYRIVVE
jgi:T5SS/PEP-CTERM-associated repeat protein